MIMNLLKRWRHADKNTEGRNERALSKRPHGQDGLTGFRKEIDRVFDRAWRDFDRFGQEPWSALGPLSPLGELSSLSELSNWPAVDTAEDENTYTVRFDVPGLEAKDIELNVSGNVLTIRGTRNDEWSENKRGVTRRERRSGSFMRSLTLPAYVDPARMEAKHENGTLTVTAPKIPEKAPKRVRVSA
jgi:HSP20 family protein